MKTNDLGRCPSTGAALAGSALSPSTGSSPSAPAANASLYDRINALGAPLSACTSDYDRGFHDAIEKVLDVLECSEPESSEPDAAPKECCATSSPKRRPVMRDLTFAELHSLIQNEQSFSLLGRFWADNLLSVSALTDEQRASLYDAWTARRIFLADRLAERSHTRKAA